MSDPSDYYEFVNKPFFSTVAVDWIFKTKTEFELQVGEGGVSRIAFLTGKKVYPNVAN